MNKCIFCNTIENITTSMQVSTSNGLKSTVWICSQHEDDASPKAIRELVDKRDKMVADFEKQAAELGFKLVPTNTNIIIASSEQPKQIQPEHIDGPKQIIKTPPVVKSQKKTMQPIVTPTTVSGHGNVEQHNSYNTASPVSLKDGTMVDAPAIIEHEVQTINGRSSVPITIPKKIVGEDGVTQINIVDTGGDKALQQRFKEITNTTEQISFSKGYKTHDCTFCNGTGISRINKQTCPKCNGKGMF
jgi:hypothetical protein